MPELVICNTSPLFYLHRLRRLEILQQLYHHLVVPEAVRDELHVGRAQGEDAPELEAYKWIQCVRSALLPGPKGCWSSMRAPCMPRASIVSEFSTR